MLLAAQMATVAHGGQVLISGSMLKKLQEEEFSVEGDKRFTSIGYLEVPSSPSGNPSIKRSYVFFVGSHSSILRKGRCLSDES